MGHDHLPLLRPGLAIGRAKSMSFQIEWFRQPDLNPREPDHKCQLWVRSCSKTKGLSRVRSVQWLRAPLFPVATTSLHCVCTEKSQHLSLCNAHAIQQRVLAWEAGVTSSHQYADPLDRRQWWRWLMLRGKGQGKPWQASQAQIRRACIRFRSELKN